MVDSYADRHDEHEHDPLGDDIGADHHDAGSSTRAATGGQGFRS